MENKGNNDYLKFIDQMVIILDFSKRGINDQEIEATLLKEAELQRPIAYAYLYENTFSIVPSFLSSLSASLTVLHLDHNQLTQLPDFISNLKMLEDLAVHNNRLESLSPSIGGLVRLKQLRVDHNNLKRLPDEIGLLVSL